MAVSVTFPFRLGYFKNLSFSSTTYNWYKFDPYMVLLHIFRKSSLKLVKLLKTILRTLALQRLMSTNRSYIFKKNLQPLAADLFKYVWHFRGHHALMTSWTSWVNDSVRNKILTRKTNLDTVLKAILIL